MAGRKFRPSASHGALSEIGVENGGISNGGTPLKRNIAASDRGVAPELCRAGSRKKMEVASTVLLTENVDGQRINCFLRKAVIRSALAAPLPAF